MSSLFVERQETSRIISIMPRQKFEGHTHSVYNVIHLPGGQQIMTCSFDGSLRVWDLKSGKQIGDDWRDGDSGVWTTAMSPDGKKAVSGSMDGGVRLWDMDTGKVVVRWMGNKPVSSVCWSGDGQRVLSGSSDGTAIQWDVESRETNLAPIKTGHEHMRAVVYSPDMTMLATGGSDDSEQVLDSLKIWDAKIGKLVATLETLERAGSVLCLAWTPDGKTLISGSYHSSIRTWSTTTWKQIAVLGEHSTDPVDSIAISPNGRILASASWDKTARLWNLDNNQPIGSPLQHPSHVLSVSFSVDGKLLATGCDDNNAYTWDVSGILKEAGLSELLLDKPVLAADATSRPVRQPIRVPQRQVPHGFFDDLPDRAQHASHPSTLRDRLFSLFHTDVHDTSSRPRPFHWVRLSGRPTGEDIELRERASGVVNVPYAKGKRRNASARERRMKIPPLKPGNSAASASLPPNNNTTQHSSDASQAQAAVSTVTAPLVVTNTTPNTNPHVIIRHAGCWTRFWLSMCCSSSEYADGHH